MMPTVSSGSSPGFSDPGVDKLLGSLDQLESKADGARPDLLFLKSLLESSEFKSLMRVHEMVTTPEAKDPPPIYENVMDMVAEVEDLMSRLTPMPEAEELSNILHDTNFQALLESHDMIALKDFHPQLPEVPHEVDEDEESVKIVRLVKGPHEPLGATIQMDEAKGKIRIARVMHGGAADRSGLIHVGDEVQEVNGVKVTGKTPNEIVKILSCNGGPITLKLVPGDDEDYLYKESRLSVRACFEYNPSDDKYIPCKEAGLGFHRGDVLHIACQDDPNWWQARKDGDKSLRAGLIPGKLLQERKEVLKAAVHGEPTKELKELKNTKSSGKFSPKLGKKNKKSKKMSFLVNQTEDLTTDEVLTYEEVDKYYPSTDSSIQRTVMLFGPPGVGCSLLQNALVSSNPDHFSRPPECTSRPKKSGESDSESFVFLSKQDMENNIQNKLYAEHWEQKGFLHGISVEHIQEIISEKKIPVISCSQPSAIRNLRNCQFKPYIVFIKPPTLDMLKTTRKELGARTSCREKQRPFTDEDLQTMIQCSDFMDENYGHFFDCTLVNGKHEEATEELVSIIEKLEINPQWVPTSWLI